MKSWVVYLFFLCSLLFLMTSLFLRYKPNFSNWKDDQLELTKISVNKSSIDVGKVADRKSASGEFYIKNLGSNDLILSNVEVSCTCSSSAFLQERILPGDSVLVTVQYDKRTEGYFFSDVLVYGNFSGSPRILSFEGFYSEAKVDSEFLN